MTNRPKNVFPFKRLLALASLAGVLFFSGCATKPQAIPTSYLNTDKAMSVDIEKIGDKAVFRDSGNGGLIGAMVALGRQGSMREKMEGIQGSTVKELLRQELTRNLEEAFYIEETSDELQLRVQVVTWGWFLPTGLFGIKGGDYQTEIIGRVEVYDMQLPQKKQRIAFTELRATDPLGSEPDDAKVQESLLKCADNFGKQVVDFLLQRGTAETPKTY